MTWRRIYIFLHTPLVAVDGLTAYLKAFRDAFRSPYKGEKGGRPRLYVWEDVAIVQVVKQRTKDSLTITRRIAQGTADQVARLLSATQNEGVRDCV